jgi:3-deoxy-D-manno-octulosonic-acid transferase
MRKFYSLAMYLGMPLILAHLALRGLRDRAYLGRWGERFGRFAPPLETGGIVVHAASVGEVNAAAPLVHALLRKYPELTLTVTTFTPTGSARAVSLFADRVFHVYVPLDLPGPVRRFFDTVRPRALIVMETEIWPNLFATASDRKIPIMLANARLSERSANGYRRIKSLVNEALQRVSYTAAQSRSDAERFIACGASPASVEVAGNLKFDIRVAPGLLEQGQALRAHWGSSRPVLLAGSTHGGEDALVVSAFMSALETCPDALLILVPRHPERFGSAAQAAREAGLRVELRSRTEACSADTQCFVIDSIGELMRYYACCDIALVGGSFAEIGGHNVLEPAALGKPVLVGPHMFSFEDITRQMVERDAAIQVQSGRELSGQLLKLFRDAELRDSMGRAGLGMVSDGRGALDRNLELFERLLET